MPVLQTFPKDHTNGWSSSAEHRLKGYNSIPTINKVTIIPRHDKQPLSTPTPVHVGKSRIPVGPFFPTVKAWLLKCRKHRACAPTLESLGVVVPLYLNSTQPLHSTRAA